MVYLIFIFLIIIVFLPVIICFFLWAGIYLLIEWLKTPLYKKQYQQSIYYHDMKIPYRSFILQMPSYTFYNTAREQHIPLELVHQDTNNIDYIIYQDAIYLFPFFDQMGYNDKKQQWEVDIDGDWVSFDMEMEKQIIDDNQSNMPVFVLLCEHELVFRETFIDNSDEVKDGDYAIDLLPACVKIGENYLSALVGESTEGH